MSRISSVTKVTQGEMNPGAGASERHQKFVNAPVGGSVKRLIDILIASIAIVLALPLMLVIAILIRVTSGKIILFAHPRVGFGGREFLCYKFRTMARNADLLLAKHLAESPEAASEWRKTQKLKNDPRVTRLGRILRKSSLDELPQLFNVLRGDLSCVGPRPITSAELPRYGMHAMDYLSARPGITGLWQVSGRTKTTYAQRVALDRYYVRRWSLFMDIRILLATIPAVLTFEETS